ncbi:hypothetical protein SH661x_002593 [Planctomicrobium sp. SH661]|uniref:hypothetical protein n=1 Tax=Planctomicrobium sp. SH661 TaxID=3448124 RepID=UPI003F5C2948
MRHLQCILALGLLLGAGCGSSGSRVESGKVEGTVQFGSAPLVSGTVLLLNESNGVGATAVVEDGKFQFSEAIPVGDYKVAVGPLPAPPPHLPPLPKDKVVKLPKKYGKSATSGLSATIKSGENKLQFQLDTM